MKHPPELGRITAALRRGKASEIAGGEWPEKFDSAIADLDKLTDAVLAYRPKPKTKAAKRRKRKAKRAENKG